LKILLINPPAFNEITTQVSRYVSGESSMQPPLGLMYIAAVLVSKGIDDVRIIDAQAEKINYEELEARILKEQPDLVGMTAMTFTMTDVMLTARTIRKVSPETKIVLGGPHVDIYPEQTINLSEIDFVIRKEGEYPFLHLVRHLTDGKTDLSEVRNLVWRDEEGRIRMNELTASMNDYSQMPFPARHLVPLDKYFSIMTENNPITTMISAKGCPYKCVFCYKHIDKVSYRSPKSIADEMEHIRGLGIREIFFVDDTFYVNSSVAMKICDEIIKRKIGMPWGARARVNNISEEMLEKFKKAGCKRLHIGVESGNDRILQNLNKKITVEMAKKAFTLCRKHKIDTLAYFIIGNPGEGQKEIEDTIKLARELKPSYAQFSRMTPFPATKLYDMAIERKIISYDYWKEYAKNPYVRIQPQFWTEHFTQEQLADLADYATHKFYFSPGYMLRSVTRVNSYRDLRRKLKTGLSLLRSTSSYKSAKIKMT